MVMVTVSYTFPGSDMENAKAHLPQSVAEINIVSVQPAKGTSGADTRRKTAVTIPQTLALVPAKTQRQVVTPKSRKTKLSQTWPSISTSDEHGVAYIQ